MTADSLTCPYCNAYVPMPAGAAPGQRLPCPRCGEAFPYRPPETGGEGPVPFSPNGNPPPFPDPRPEAPPPPRRWSNRAVAGGVLGVMAVMAVAGLIFAFKTVPNRRSHDPKGPIGYLPGDVNVIAAVQLREALADPGGHEFLNQLHLGPVEAGMASVEKWTGLKREEINQVVLGLKLDGHGIPRLTLVVQTRDPYGEKEVREALHADRPIERGGKTLYRFKLPVAAPLATQAELWCASDTILVIGLAQDLDAVPLSPQSGVDHFSAPLQGLLRDQVSYNPQAWVVAHSDQWNKTIAWHAVRGLPAADQELLAKAATWGIWLRFDKIVYLNAVCKCTDATAAEGLKEYLVRHGVVEPEQVKVSQGTWVTAETQPTPGGIRQALAQAFGGSAQR